MVKNRGFTPILAQKILGVFWFVSEGRSGVISSARPGSPVSIRAKQNGGSVVVKFTNLVDLKNYKKGKC